MMTSSSGSGCRHARMVSSGRVDAAARVAQGGGPAHSAAAAANTLDGSPGARPPAPAPAMPRDTLTSRPPPAGRQPAAARRGAIARAPARSSPPWAPTPGHEERRGPARSPGSRRARPGAVAPTTRPTVPPGPQPAPGARRARGAAPPARRPPRRRRPRGPAARRRRGWTSGTGRRRTDPARSSSGAIASAPRYGLTVTASAPSTSKSATAWRAAVDPMSPRFASAMTGRSAGASPGAAPGRPCPPTRTPRRTRGSA